MLTPAWAWSESPRCCRTRCPTTPQTSLVTYSLCLRICVHTTGCMQLLIVSWSRGVPGMASLAIHRYRCCHVRLQHLLQMCLQLLGSIVLGCPVALPRVVSDPIQADAYARPNGTTYVRMFGASFSACSNGIPTGFGAVVLGVHAL